MAKSKHPGKPHKRAKGQYLQLFYAMIKHLSFKALSADAVRVLIQMHLGFHGCNNGQVGFSIRQAAECLHSGKWRAMQAFDQMQEYGFIVCHTQSSFNMKTKKAREWEITFQQMPSGPPSHAWKKLKHGSISDTDGRQAGTVSPKETWAKTRTVPDQVLYWPILQPAQFRPGYTYIVPHEWRLNVARGCL